jgi:hypothetical protein
MPLPDTPPRGFRMPSSSMPAASPPTGPIDRRPASPLGSPLDNGFPGAGSDDRPALPRRTRQANLVPQLRDDTGSHAELRVDEDLPPAETTRDRLSAFQRGTQQGRDDDD